jgi:hypothetical protein
LQSRPRICKYTKITGKESRKNKALNKNSGKKGNIIYNIFTEKEKTNGKQITILKTETPHLRAANGKTFRNSLYIQGYPYRLAPVQIFKVKNCKKERRSSEAGKIH